MSSAAFLSPIPLISINTSSAVTTTRRKQCIVSQFSMTAATSTLTKVGIIGASGYTGSELLRLLSNHPLTEITLLTAESSAGKPLSTVHPHLSYLNHGNPLPPLQHITSVKDWSSAAEIYFCCLPHATTQELISSLPLSDVRVVDLSADFRLRDPATYEQWYGGEHLAKQLQKDAIYGLTELFRPQVHSARLVANPGCYPTSAQLPLIPLLREKLIKSEDIIIDAKSGTSGAGRAPKIGSLFCEVADGIAAYGVGKHRHLPEIEQGLSDAYGEKVHVSFTPHLMPMSRGILETIYVKTEKGINVSMLREQLQKTYKDEPFVHVLPEGSPTPQTRHVRGSNLCVMSVVEDAIPGRAIIVSVLDNVVKGASGQAVQNMNVMMGFPETMGLTMQPTFP